MGKEFFEDKFNSNTLLKLDVFKRYIREWLPTFATESPKNRGIKKICIYDLFCGPGRDADQRPGSPLIILQEIQEYAHTHPDLKNNIPIHVIFNDNRPEHIERLRSNIDKLNYTDIHYNLEYHSTVVPHGALKS